MEALSGRRESLTEREEALGRGDLATVAWLDFEAGLEATDEEIRHKLWRDK